MAQEYKENGEQCTSTHGNIIGNKKLEMWNIFNFRSSVSGHILHTLLLILLLSATSCSKGDFGTRAGPPWMDWMFEGPPPGKEYTPLYVEGWKAGCETGTSAAGNQWYKMHYKFRQDPIMAQNRVYYKGWKDAFDFCQRYIYQYDRRLFL